jgi:hypothetical protein
MTMNAGREGGERHFGHRKKDGLAIGDRHGLALELLHRIGRRHGRSRRRSLEELGHVELGHGHVDSAKITNAHMKILQLLAENSRINVGSPKASHRAQLLDGPGNGTAARRHGQQMVG